MNRDKLSQRSRSSIGVQSVALACLIFVGCRPGGQLIEPLPADQIEMTFSFSGATHHLVDGVVYREHPNGRWEWVARPFDPAEVARSYSQREDQWFRVDPDSGREFPVRRDFADGFEVPAEGLVGLRQLVGEEHGWSELTLQTERAPNIPDYVALRQQIIKNDGQFLDARVEPLSVAAHSGERGLRCVCPAKGPGMVCSKASLSMPLGRWVRGDVVRVSGWFRVVGSRHPHTIVDLECSYAEGSPGLRIVLGEHGELAAELKSINKHNFRQAPETAVRFPTGRWVQVTAEVLLETVQGHVRIWQDDALVLDQPGPTLPFPSAIIDKLEMGVSAHSYGTETVTLDLDDIEVRIVTNPGQPAEENSQPVSELSVQPQRTQPEQTVDEERGNEGGVANQ